MSEDVEYLLLKEKGPYHEVFVRSRRLNTNPGLCRFYTIVIAVTSVSLVVLLLSLVYIFVLVPAWQEHVLSWDGGSRRGRKPLTHVLTHTQCGPVEGSIEGDDVFVFKGVPYALPPVGPRRWAKPQKLQGSTCWRGVHLAKRFRDVCVQPRYNSSSLAGDEDCLYLNVWTQSLHPSDNLPVLFWVHGGYLRFGSGSASPFCPTAELTRSTRAVYVSLNYRLGPLGFLALDALGQSSSTGTSGNYGLMDIVLALQWVRDNIKNFGGNPNMVTVFGQRAGGTALHALLASPLAGGLFHRAWLVSPSLLLNQTSAQASEKNEALQHVAGCSQASCLRNLSCVEVMHHSPWGGFPFRPRGPQHPEDRLQGRCADYQILVDGYVLKESPLQAWKHRRGNDVPILFTTSTDHREIEPPSSSQQAPHTTTPGTWEQYTTLVRNALGQFSPGVAEKALLLYPATSAVSPRLQISRMTSDECVTCQVHTLVNAASATFRSPIFYAVITSLPSPPVKEIFNDSRVQPFEAFYSGDWDLMAFFGDFDYLGYQPSRKDAEFQRLIRREVMAFARNGKPETPFWHTAQNCTALLSDHVFPVTSYNQERCEFWFDSGLYSSYERMN